MKSVLNGTWLEWKPFFNGKHSVIRIFNLMQIHVLNGACLQHGKKKKNQSLAVVIGRFHCMWIRNKFNIWNAKNANLETGGMATHNKQEQYSLQNPDFQQQNYIISAFILQWIVVHVPATFHSVLWAFFKHIQFHNDRGMNLQHFITSVNNYWFYVDMFHNPCIN